jgi:hypothetical protein
MLNTYLREFVQASINDWVEFIKSFTKPKTENAELWKLNTEPFVIINLDKFKDKKAKKGHNAYSIGYSPNLNECSDFMVDALHQMIKSTNAVETFENDLMTFLELDKKPSFFMTADFPWITDALKEIKSMIAENIVEPERLLTKYQKFDFILNTDPSKLVKELFNNKERAAETENEADIKADIQEIRATLRKFDQAADDIMVLSNDDVDYQMFRIKALDLKKTLCEKANKIKQSILDQAATWCKEKVLYIYTTYRNMQEEITKTPMDEKQLVDLKEFIRISKEDTQPMLKELLDSVEQHYRLCDEFFVIYDQEDIENCLQMKKWPTDIEEAIGQSASQIENQETMFKEKLEQEQNQFMKDLKEYDAQYQYIITYNNFEKIQDYVLKSYNLNKALEDAEEAVEKFHVRETLFGQKELSEYPDLGRLKADFQPFYELINISNMVKNNIQYEYVKNTLMSYTYEDMDENVTKWH